MSLQVQADLLLECGRRQDTVHEPNDTSSPRFHRQRGSRFQVDNVGPDGFATLIAAETGKMGEGHSRRQHQGRFSTAETRTGRLRALARSLLGRER
jgi:hypothetical protein